MGYLKKMGSEESLMNRLSFQKRYFILDLFSCEFKYAKTPTSSKFRTYNFKSIQSVEMNGPNMYSDKKYMHAFLVVCSDRSYHLCALTFEER